MNLLSEKLHKKNEDFKILRRKYKNKEKVFR